MASPPNIRPSTLGADRWRFFRPATTAVILIIAMLSLCCGNMTPTAVQLRYAHPNSPNDVPGRYASTLAELVERKTAGSLRIEVYPSSQLGGVREMIEGARLGIIDMGHNSFAALAPFQPDIAVFNFPYLYEDIDHAVLATDPQTSPVLQQLNEQLIASSDLKILGSYFFGIRRLTTSNFPVYSPEDLRGRKIRAIPLAIWISTIKGMGAIPTPVDFAELPTALATNIVHGQENPVNTIFASKIFQLQNFLILTDHMIDVNIVYINNTSWSLLSSENQLALREAHKEASAIIRSESEDLQVKLLRELENEGMTIISSEDGLDIASFKLSVSTQMETDFSHWTPYVKRIRQLGRTIE